MFNIKHGSVTLAWFTVALFTCFMYQRHFQYCMSVVKSVLAGTEHVSESCTAKRVEINVYITLHYIALPAQGLPIVNGLWATT